MIFFSHPAGLWALLAIPVILLIHFLQERSRKVRASTLFLLERIAPKSVHGARFDRLINSVPLWLQILAALVLTWLLTEPRWIKADSRQTIVIVLDSSVSMSAFAKKLRPALEDTVSSCAAMAAATEWHLLESDPRRPTVYSGTDLTQLLKAYDGWEPMAGSHLPDDVLLTARGLVKEHGLVILVTDRPVEVPIGVAVLSVGEVIENVGFAGVEIEPAGAAGSATRWRALVKNYGKERATRHWDVKMQTPGSTLEVLPPDAVKMLGARTLTVDAGQTLVLTGELPPDVERAVLMLEGDTFTWDDLLPVQKPNPRVVQVDARLGDAGGKMLREMIGALDQVAFGDASTPADLVISELGNAVDTHAIQPRGAAASPLPLDGTWTVAEDHPLTRDLNWTGLITSKPAELFLSDQDEPLLWKGDRPLAFIRNELTADGRKLRKLMLPWDLAGSNAARHPAMLVMLHRFIEEVRLSKAESWAGNFEVRQRLDLAAPIKPLAEGQTRKIRLHADGKQSEFAGSTPSHVSFFEVVENDEPRISGAAVFADTRESDFNDAAPLDTVAKLRREAALKQSETDPWTPLWLLALLGCFIGSWAWRSGARRTQSVAPSTSLT